ncbi:hypothetical protein CQY20_30005 [Mycolicibacterium agri]|uniref:Uncharacterized protein n=1 Tax=Mycolicibacterium agri TaxID=36811 RepID=A0A2A7MQ01_MYCAG|nr:hypothetical protein [Mycolicibacterium agri]PEG33583.1 hypothetical protein CQY20_30005 [Mycolicibacterium agri]GFG52361.1 hypothetical protein MAGR_38020 [Mycolicibacterium agri]
MNEVEKQQIWRLVVETTQKPDGTWQAGVPGRDWSVTGDSEDEARDRAVAHAIEIGEDADEIVRNKPRPPIELEDDDPRVGWVWRFTPQTEQFSDGTWRAWFASGGWVVTGATEQDAIDKANTEWFRRRDDPEETARRLAMMRRHLVEPQPGVQNTPSSVLEPAWNDPNPTRAVADIIDGLA